MSDSPDWITGDWQAGQRRRVIEARCCPQCGSTHVRTSATNVSFTYFKCAHCTTTWKEARS
jgi:transposase-like protein